MTPEIMPEVTPIEPVTPEVAETETSVENQTEDPNAESIELINRFAPDSDTSSPEAIIAGQLSILKQMVPIHDKLYEMATTGEAEAAFIADLIDTGDPITALVRNYDESEIKGAMESMDAGDYDEAKGAYSEKTTALKAKKDQVQKNMDISINDVSEFMEERKDWTPEKSQAFEDFVLGIIDDGKNGLIGKEALIGFEKSFNYDGDVANAEANGQVMGRNEKIITQKATKEQLAELLPEGNSGMATPPPKPMKPRSYASKFMDGVM